MTCIFKSALMHDAVIGSPINEVAFDSGIHAKLQILTDHSFPDIAYTIMMRFFYKIGVTLWLLVASGLCANASTNNSIETWRNEAAAARIQAENDVPAAYKEALRLQTTLPANATPADQAKVLNLLGRIEAYMAQIESSTNHLRQALELAKQNGDRIGQAEAYFSITLNAIYQARIDILIDTAPRALEVLEGIDRPDLLGEAMLRLAMMYRRIGQFDESVTLCMQAMEIAKDTNNPLAMIYAYQGMGISYEQSERYIEAYNHYSKMRDLARAMPMRQREADAVSGMAAALNISNNPSDLRTAESLSREAVALYQAIGTRFNYARGLFQLSDILHKQSRSEETLPLLDEAITIYDRYQNKIGLWWSLNARSENLQSMGRLAEAQADAERAYALAQDIGLLIYRSGSTRRMAEMTAIKGDYKRAYQFSSEAADLEAKSVREKSSSRMLELAQRYKSEHKQQQIDRLTLREQHRVLQQRWLWTVLGGSLALLTVTTYFLLRLRRSHRLLEASNMQLRQSKDEIHILNISLEQRVQERTDELRQQTSYLRTLVDTLPVSVWLKDIKSRYLTINTNNVATNGYTAEQMIGKTDLELWPGDIGLAFRATDLEVMNTRQRKTQEIAIPGPNNAVFWREIDKAPVIDEYGTVLGIVGIGRDISERKAAETAREAALAEAMRLAKLRSEFIAYMSHELRTPLNGILGYAQILQQDRTLDERNTVALNVIRQSGEHLLALVEDILDLARIETGRLELTVSNISLGRFLSIVTGIVRVKALQKGLEFTCDLAPDLPEDIRGDEKRLRQVLLNLLTNAVELTDQGHVLLRVSRVTPSRLCFAIQDTGIGIDAAELETLFHYFEQSGNRRHRSDGMGIGLAISQQLVHLMGGDIEVKSRGGEGTTLHFELELPMAEVLSPPRLSLPIATEYTGPRRKILIVGEIAENRTAAVNLLAPLGFDTIESGSGREALELARSTLPDLILMDDNLPDMDRQETTQRLTMQIPIVVWSANAPDDAKKAYPGAGDFTPKSTNQAELLTQIAELLDFEWIFAQSLGNSAKPDESAEPLVFPPNEEMQTLYQLAQQGNMRDIMHYAERIAGLDPGYCLFAARLRSLAEGYQSKAIFAFVEQHLNDAPVCETPN